MTFAALWMLCAYSSAQSPPTIVKSFSASTIALNSSTTLTFTITNPNAGTALTGVAFTDNLPSGLIIANPDSLSGNCDPGVITPTAHGISLSGGQIAASGSCTFSIDVMAVSDGTQVNTTGTVSSTEGGTGGTATASITVAPQPTISKFFSPTAATVNGTASLRFTITNSDSTTALTGLAFTDSLPAGMVVATPNGLSNGCGGSVTAAAGSSSVSLSSGTLGTSSSCNITLNVKATNTGLLSNTTGPISSTQSGSVAPSNTATLQVVSAPTLSKAFAPTSIAPGGTSVLTFTVANTDSANVMHGFAFTDPLPAGLVVATPNGLTGTCVTAGATISATAGSNSIIMSSLDLSASSSCAFTVNVTALASAGASQVNTTSAITAAVDDGTGAFVAVSGGSATATLSVLVPDLTITKSHTGNFAQGQTGATYTITITNSGLAPTSAAVTLTDTLPTGLTATAISGTGWTCPTLTSCNRSDVLAASASYPPITLTVSVALNAPSTVTNTATVSGGGDPNTANNTASNPTTVTPFSGPSPITITPVSGSATVTAGHLALFTLTVTSVDPSTLGPLNFACSNLPRGTSCDFDKQGETQTSTLVTLAISTSIHSSSVVSPSFGRSSMLYAALVLPMFGLLLAGSGGLQKRGLGVKRASTLKVWLGTLLAGLLILLAGCSNSRPTSTPSGTYPITVTATSSANPSINATATVNLTVQ